MKILGVYANTTKLLNPPPVGLMLVGQNAIEHGHEFEILDLLQEKNRDAALSRRLAEYRPELVAFSFRNLDNQDMLEPESYIPNYQRWVAMANAAAPTVIGGSAFSTYPAEMMEAVAAGYGMCGDAGSSFSDFIGELAAGKKSFKTPGVYWRDGKNIRHNPGLVRGYPGASGNLNWDLVNLKSYRGMEGMSNAIITKTGCHYDCLFCDTRVTFGDRFMPREPDAIIEQMRENQRRWKLNRYGYFFVDAIFNEPMDWTKELMDKIIRSKLRIAFSCVFEPTAFDRELIALMVRAGCVMATGLIVSAADPVLAANKKTFTKSDLVRFFDLLKREKLPFMPQYMLGVPGETKSTVTETVDFAASRRMVMTQIGLGARIQRATGLYNIALGKGMIKRDDNLLYPKFYWEPSVPLEWAKAEAARFKKQKKTAYLDWVRIMGRSMAAGIRN